MNQTIYIVLSFIFSLTFSISHAQCTEEKDAEMAKYMQLTKTQDAQGCSQCGMLALYFCSAKYCATEQDKNEVSKMIAAGKANIKQMGQPYCCPEYLNREPEWGVMVGNLNSAQTKISNNSLSNNSSPEELEVVLNNIVKLLEINPDNPLNIDKTFLFDLSNILPSGNLKSTIQSYSSNFGNDKDLSIRQIYWDIATALDQNASIASSNQYSQTSQNLNAIFNNYNLLSEKLKTRGGDYQFGSFVTDPVIMNSLTSLSGSYENAQAIGAGVELVLMFTEAYISTKKYKEDYIKLAKLSIQNKYIEKDIRLNNALIDSYVGIEEFQSITSVYRFDFKHGASIRVENGILKYFNDQKGIVKPLMVVDKGHDGELYNSKILRGGTASSINVSPDEKRFYIYVNPIAISDVKCENCLKKCGYIINAENGEIIYTKLGEKLDWQNSPSSPHLTFDTFNNPKSNTFVARNNIFMILSYSYSNLNESTLTYNLLDDNKSFIINGQKKKFFDSPNYSLSIFTHRKSPFFYFFDNNNSYISLIWANSLNNGLITGDETRYCGSMLQISKSRDNVKLDYFNGDGMQNEITGLAMSNSKNLYFIGQNGSIGKLNSDEYQLTDPSLTSEIRNSLGSKVLEPFDFIGNQHFVSAHGRISTIDERTVIYPNLKFSPDEKSLLYTVKNNLYVINPENLSDINHYILTFQPNDFFFTKENGDWVINLRGLNDYKFPIIKKYSLGKLSTMDMKKASDKSGSEPNATNSNFSLADEIKKLKDLFDAGAITQEEYEAGKKQLLSR